MKHWERGKEKKISSSEQLKTAENKIDCRLHEIEVNQARLVSKIDADFIQSAMQSPCGQKTLEDVKWWLSRHTAIDTSPESPKSPTKPHTGTLWTPNFRRTKKKRSLTPSSKCSLRKKRPRSLQKAFVAATAEIWETRPQVFQAAKCRVSAATTGGSFAVQNQLCSRKKMASYFCGNKYLQP